MLFVVLQSLACDKLNVPVAWFALQQPYGMLVIDWLTGFWPDGNLALLLAHLHFAETQLAAGVMLLQQLVSPADGAQQPACLPAMPSQRELSAFIVETLWANLQHVSQLPRLVADDAHRLRQTLQSIQLCEVKASSQRFIIMAAHDLLDDCAADSMQQLHHVLNALVQLGSTQLSPTDTFVQLLELLPTLEMPTPATFAAETLVFDLIKRIGRAQDSSPPLHSQLLAALTAVFSSRSLQRKHMQEHMLLELLSPETLQPTNRAKVRRVEDVLYEYAGKGITGASSAVLLQVQEAKLTYLPGCCGNLRCVMDSCSLSIMPN